MLKIYDTLISEYIKNPGVKGLSLDKLANKYFNYKMISYEQITNNKSLLFNEVELNKASVYSAEDVYITAKLFELQKNNKDNQNKILNEIELPLIDVIKLMELAGVKIDKNKLAEIGELLKKELLFLENKIYEISSVKFNINSPKQVGEILFDKLALSRSKKNKTGYSVSADVLGELSHEFEIAQDIVDYRHYSKLLSTYIEGLTNILDNNDFLHTSYNQAVTTTGRLSSTKPNLQNIPSSHGLAGTIREAFISRFIGGKILAIDYSQVEVRLLAILSKDENLLNSFKNGADIHHTTAKFIFGKNDINTSERKVAKVVNFGVIYGISSFGLSKMINISMKESKDYIEKFFISYPDVKKYFDNTIKSCEKKGYVETLYGRRRYISGINDSNKIIKQAAQREAINMPIQGTSADIIKLAMIRVDKFIKENNLHSKLIMQVHDELVFDIYPNEEQILKDNCTQIMENILVGYEISLLCEAKIGNNWRNAK